MQRILIVEDSPTMRALLAATLEELGDVEVTEAANGFEALRILPHASFDLIITDVNMPDINGLELVSFVRRNAAFDGTPLVIVSTEGSDRDREKGLDLGADAYMVKPFESGVLRDTVSDLLKRRPGGNTATGRTG